MAIFNSYVSLPEGNLKIEPPKPNDYHKVLIKIVIWGSVPYFQEHPNQAPSCKPRGTKWLWDNPHRLPQCLPESGGQGAANHDFVG